jgi:hypothetical protein
VFLKNEKIFKKLDTYTEKDAFSASPEKRKIRKMAKISLFTWQELV